MQFRESVYELQCAGSAPKVKAAEASLTAAKHALEQADDAEATEKAKLEVADCEKAYQV